MSNVVLTVLMILGSYTIAFLFAYSIDKWETKAEANKDRITRSCLNHLISLENKKSEYEKAGNKIGFANCVRFQRYWVVTKGGVTTNNLIKFDHIIELLHSEDIDDNFKAENWIIVED